MVSTETAKPLSQTTLSDSLDDVMWQVEYSVSCNNNILTLDLSFYQQMIVSIAQNSQHVVNGLSYSCDEAVSVASSHVSLLVEEHTVPHVHLDNWVPGVIFPLAPQYGGLNFGSSSLAAGFSHIFSTHILTIQEILPFTNLPSRVAASSIEILPSSDTSYLVEPEVPSSAAASSISEEILPSSDTSYLVKPEVPSSAAASSISEEILPSSDTSYLVEPEVPSSVSGECEATDLVVSRNLRQPRVSGTPATLDMDVLDDKFPLLLPYLIDPFTDQ